MENAMKNVNLQEVIPLTPPSVHIAALAERVLKAANPDGLTQLVNSIFHMAYMNPTRSAEPLIRSRITEPAVEGCSSQLHLNIPMPLEPGSQYPTDRASERRPQAQPPRRSAAVAADN
jgi:hypothetical protein